MVVWVKEKGWSILSAPLEVAVAGADRVEVEGIDEQQAVVVEPAVNATQDAEGIEQMVHGLANQDHVEAAVTGVEGLGGGADRLEAVCLCRLGFPRRRIDTQRVDVMTLAEVQRDLATRGAEVEQAGPAPFEEAAEQAVEGRGRRRVDAPRADRARRTLALQAAVSGRYQSR